MALREVSIDFKIGGIGVGTKWTPNEAEQLAAWELLLQLGTRTTISPLPDDQGLIREALTSLYQFFDITRVTLTKHGPQVAQDKGHGDPSLATIAALILNQHLRPVLSKWHPLLDDHESSRPAATGPLTWEAGWEHRDAARQDLIKLREMLRQYLGLLGRAAGTSAFAHALLLQIEA